jgi:hypothetical protein
MIDTRLAESEAALVIDQIVGHHDPHCRSSPELLQRARNNPVHYPNTSSIRAG